MSCHRVDHHLADACPWRVIRLISSLSGTLSSIFIMSSPLLLLVFMKNNDMQHDTCTNAHSIIRCGDSRTLKFYLFSEIAQKRWTQHCPFSRQLPSSGAGSIVHFDSSIPPGVLATSESVYVPLLTNLDLYGVKHTSSWPLWPTGR